MYMTVSSSPAAQAAAFRLKGLTQCVLCFCVQPMPMVRLPREGILMCAWMLMHAVVHRSGGGRGGGWLCKLKVDSWRKGPRCDI